jgi:hypothetical protein
MRDLLRHTYYIIAVYRGTDPHGRHMPTMALECKTFTDADVIARSLGGSWGERDAGHKRFSSVEVCGFVSGNHDAPVTLRRYGLSGIEHEHPALRDMVQGEVFA